MRPCSPFWTWCMGLILLASSAVGQAQDADPGTIVNARQAQLDLAVPDAPAFKILETEPSDIMRPSSMREVAIAVAGFLTSGSVLPKSFAAEVAPYSLISSQSLGEYRQNPFWYRARVSVGTATSSTNGTDISLGLRFTLRDGQDLRLDKTLTEELLTLGQHINSVMADAAAEAGDPDAPDFQEKFDALLAEKLETDDEINSTIESARERAKVRNWNKGVTEIGFAGLGSSPDSLAQNMKLARFGLWFTNAFPIFGQDGQVVMGVNAAVQRNAYDRFGDGTVNAALRTYGGLNQYKGFLEASLSGSWLENADGTTDFEMGYGISLGGEINLSNGIWIDGSVGVVKEGDTEAAVKSTVNVKLATPEL